MKLKFSAFLIVTALALSACSSKSKKEITGEALFKGYGCNTCHRVGGVGGTVAGGTLGPDLSYVGFRKSPEWLDLWLKNPQAWKHNTSMPNFYLKDNHRKLLVEYLASLKGEAYRDNPPWNAPDVKDDPIKRGRVLFQTLGCSGCHGVEGKGGYPNNNVIGGKIPTLTLVAEGYSKEELVEKLRIGVEHPQKAVESEPDPMIHMPSWGKMLKDDELESLADYLISLRPQGGGDSWE